MGYVFFYIYSIEGFNRIPANVSGIYFKLNEDFSQELQTIEWPKEVSLLDFTNCILKTISNLPDGLANVSFKNCKNLESIPELPDSIKAINLAGCDKLPNSISLIDKLTGLEKRGVEVECPGHIDRNADVTGIKQLLSDGYREYYKNDPNLKNKKPDPSDRANYPTLALLSRFLNEATAVRGGVNGIVTTVLPIAEFINQNPLSLKILDKSSERYLEACINQPVAGFVDICFLTEMIKNPDIESKLNMAKKLLIADIIREQIANFDVGAEVEVEFANAILREVHKKFIKNKDINEPWPGIPDGIAYEETIKSKLTEENIEKVYQVAKDKINTLSTEDVIEYLCNGALQDAWAQIIIPSEEYNKLIEPLMQIKNKHALLLDSEQYLQAEEIERKISNIETECRMDILKKARDITMGYNFELLANKMNPAMDLYTRSGGNAR